MNPVLLARRGWRRLTSMRTALILLFLLAVASVPGSLLPQKPLNPQKVTAYVASHGAWGRFLDTVGAFDVFGSVWFAAIYLLLFVSLVGCLIPRIRVYARSLARKPLPAPRHLSKLPESGRFHTEGGAEAYATAARSALGRRWRVTRRVEDSGAVTLAAEKGYSREAGNLLFHIALLVALVLVAIGRLYNYEGSRIVVQGDGFCNTISQYDQWKPGRFAAQGKVTPGPFCIDKLNKFTAKYSKTGEPRTFRADLTYRPEQDAAPRTYALTVNNPLRLDGDRVYLISHGYAPTLTIRMPDGTVRTETQAFLPTDASTLYSEGAFKLLGKPDAKQDVGISGFFAPTPGLGASGLVTSVSPDVKNPVLGMFVYIGAINPNGTPESVYRLNTAGLKQIGKPTNLIIGQTKTFPNGIAITFDGWKPWVSLQVSHDPTQGYLLIAAVAMVLGLALSLGVRRRRLWIRIAPPRAGEGGSPTVVTVGGLARSDSGNFTTEFSALLDRLRSVAADEGDETGHVAGEIDDAKADTVGAVSAGSGKKD